MANPKSAPSIDPAMAKAAALAASGVDADNPGVDKIRDLLFGNQMQDYERRFSILEERFLQKLRDAEAEAARNLANMEAALRKQMESFVTQLGAEKDARGEADTGLQKAIAEQGQSQDRRSGQIADRVSNLERDFTERLARESQKLHDEIRSRNDDLHATLERMFRELSNVQTDRNLLAGLFIEVAKCLNQETIPRPAANRGNGSGEARA